MAESSMKYLWCLNLFFDKLVWGNLLKVSDKMKDLKICGEWQRLDGVDKEYITLGAKHRLDIIIYRWHKLYICMIMP